MLFILFSALSAIIGIILALLLVHVVLSWLIAFEVVSPRNNFIGAVFQFTTRVTDPMLRPFRRLIPPIAGVDLSILVLGLILILLRDTVLWWVYGLLTGQNVPL